MGISTHILDTAAGRPAAGVRVVLSYEEGNAWKALNETATDADGRCRYLLPEAQALRSGIFKVHFATAAYHSDQGLVGLYPYVEIVFQIHDIAQHYHVPLLLTANGYTTYRGS